MKPFKVLLAAIFLLAFTTAQARVHRTLNIANATIAYDAASKTFRVTGIVAGPTDAENLADPFIRIFIETGDGNYIQETATYDEVAGRTLRLPKTGSFEYRAAGPFTVTATLVKTYDKGGPRARLMNISNLTPPANPDADNGLRYPSAGISLSTFDNVVVPDDVMTGVLTINNSYLKQAGLPIITNQEFTLNIDNLLQMDAAAIRRPPTDETDITVGLKFSPREFNAGSIKIPLALFGSAERLVYIKRKSSDQLLSREMDGSEIILDFKNEKLEGTNYLPTGHFRTRGKIIFTIKLVETVGRGQLADMQAVVRFGSGKGNEVLTFTNLISFTPKSVSDVCAYKNLNCPGLRNCFLCKQPALRGLWLCR